MSSDDLTLPEAYGMWRREFEGSKCGPKFRAWLREWWPDHLNPDGKLRRLLGKTHPNVVLGDARRAVRDAEVP
jgi:hypothetical protein